MPVRSRSGRYHVAMNKLTAPLRIADRNAPVGRPSPGARLSLMLAGILLNCSSPAGEQDLEPVTRQPWQETVVSVSHIDRTARFFLGIGGYEAKWRGPLDSALLAAWELPPEASAEALLLGPAEYESGLIRLVRFDNAGERLPMRPGSRSWDIDLFAVETPDGAIIQFYSAAK